MSLDKGYGFKDLRIDLDSAFEHSWVISQTGKLKSGLGLSKISILYKKTILGAFLDKTIALIYSRIHQYKLLLIKTPLK